MVEQMKMTGPWFVIYKKMGYGPQLSKARDQEDAMRIATERALVPGSQVYIAQAMVEVRPQMAVVQLVESVSIPDLDADAPLADGIPDEIEGVEPQPPYTHEGCEPTPEDPGPVGNGSGVEETGRKDDEGRSY